jgi:hypothetical protein
VEVDSDNESASGVAGKKIKLQEQALNGTASAVVESGFTLTVPPDSAFALLTGATFVNVLEVQGTELKGIASVQNGSALRVRGLLFHSTGQYTLVATKITP